MPSIDANEKAAGALIEKGLFFAVRKAVSFYQLDSLADRGDVLDPGETFEVSAKELGAPGKEGLAEELHGAITRGRITAHKTEAEAEEKAKEHAKLYKQKEEAAVKQASVGGDVLALLEWQKKEIVELRDAIETLQAGGSVGGENPGLKAEFDGIKERLDAVEGGEGGAGEGAGALQAELSKISEVIEAMTAQILEIGTRLTAAEENVIALLQAADDEGVPPDADQGDTPPKPGRNK